MSILKQISLMVMGLSMSFVFACAPKQIRLETGEEIAEQATQVMETETEQKVQKVDSKSLIYVYVCGMVKNPGVYCLSEGDRIYQAVEMAGGILLEGDANRLNLAELLVDGQKIYVPSYDETQSVYESEGEIVSLEDGKVNINRASKEELMTLPGIGASKAEAILSYRQECGRFRSIDELMNVEGIKEGTYSRIKDRISIN